MWPYCIFWSVISEKMSSTSFNTGPLNYMWMRRKYWCLWSLISVLWNQKKNQPLIYPETCFYLKKFKLWIFLPYQFHADGLLAQGNIMFACQFFFPVGMFTYNSKARCFWFNPGCVECNQEFNLVGVVSLNEYWKLYYLSIVFIRGLIWMRCFKISPMDSSWVMQKKNGYFFILWMWSSKISRNSLILIFSYSK